MAREYKQVGRPTLAGLGLVVVAFMVLSLLVTATGTARFAVAMGYDARIGYVVGAIFDIAKGILPIALFALLARRAFGTAVLLGASWVCLVAYSCLATHATVSTAIARRPVLRAPCAREAGRLRLCRRRRVRARD